MMLAPSYIKICPRCGSERPPTEMSCENVVENQECRFPLEDVEIRIAGSTGSVKPPVVPGITCTNGHPLESGDQVCLICGADAAPASTASPVTEVGEMPEDGCGTGAPATATIIDGWTVERSASSRGNTAIDRYVVSREPGSRKALLSLYREGFEPDPAVYEVLRRMPLDHIPELLATGRHEGRAYDVVEFITQGSLAELGFPGANDRSVLRRLVEELGRALADFTERGLRHRDLRPDAILLRTHDPLDLVITDFSSARLSDFDLEAVAPLELTRYSAPEAMVGTVSAASDWWSLGMIILEQATAGGCFQGVNEQAFRLHAVTRGIDIPIGLDSEIRVLLKGLLTRDPSKRWAASQLFAWLKGEIVAAEDVPERRVESGPAIALNERSYTSPDLFSLAAAGSDNWDAARDLAIRGVVATWLSERKFDPRTVAEVRRLVSEQNLTEDFRLALILMAINPALPLTFKGEIITPAWLLSHPQDGYEVVTGEVGKQLERMDRESWIMRLRVRAVVVRERAKLLEVDFDEERLRTVLLATSRANLEAERSARRCIYPDSDHAGLTSILERPRISDEDLIILISAKEQQLTPLATLVDKALELAGETGVALDRAQLSDQFVEPRREIFGRIDERIANFSRCGIQRVDEWADAFRIERRLTLPRAIVLLAVPEGRWEAPKGQQYVASLLDHLEKRVAGTIARGPLVRFTIGKTTPRVDLFELGTSQRPGEALLNHVLSRADAPMPIDPAGLLADAQREARLRRLASHAHTFRRDTGIDGRYLGFPFVLVRDGRMTSTKARIAPVLLWPIVLDVANGAGRTASLMFDRDREEIRLNPALEGLFGTQEFARWKAAREDLLARGTFKIGDVMDVFGALAAPLGRELAAVPSKDTNIPAESRQLAPAGALFNAEFTGQAVANDLRQLRQTPPAGTSLEAMLRIPDASKVTATIAAVREQDRYVVVESDPSQDAAILQARVAPGLLVEGPPGTGKSQTIVNIVADAMGRGETVLIVCQKYSALKVVHKRLEAEGLENRSFLLVDTTRDRQGTINAIQDQIAKVRTIPSGRVASLRHKRIEHAARIEAIEAQLDRHHSALHTLDDISGASYRMLISELVGVESEGQFIVATGLRQLFAKSSRSHLSSIEETCAPLARLWLSSAYERNPLHVLRPFAVDDAIETELSAALAEFSTAEVQRCALLAKGEPVFEMDDPAPFQAWLQQSRLIFENMSQVTRQGVVAWLDLFRPHANGDNNEPIGHGLIKRLSGIKTALLALNANAHDDDTFDAITALTPAALRSRRLDAIGATGSASFWRIVSLARWSQRRRIRAYLATLGEDGGLPRIAKLCEALELEEAVRPLRRASAEVNKALRLSAAPVSPSITVLRRDIDRLLAVLRPVEAAAMVALSCPRPADGQAMARTGTAEAFTELARTYQQAFARHASRVSSRSALERLSGWFKKEWIARCTEVIAHGEPTDPSLDSVISALPTLQSYQRFRARVDDIGPDAVRAFAVLRGNEDQLKAFVPTELEGVIRRTMRREALLSWKARVEESTPDLLLEREEARSKIINLARLDDEMRTLNRDVLAIDIEPTRIGSTANWQNILRLRGPNARSLRQIFDEGTELGLMNLRPIWLMNPDVASRVLPLKAGLFDVVVFDEASQIPVELAVPSLFRAKRTVIAGDDKQMPPSNFFASRIDDGEAEGELDSDAALDDAATEAERAVFEEAWNKREVKDCPDLLQLGRGILPTTMLQIHYRSNYRELINYSNAAFYKGGLNVPVRHPTAEIKRVRPIEVIQVDGVYEKQTNEAEALRIVDLLADYWRDTAARCGSIGVVSFNRKQADLIEETIEARAEVDAAFLSAYTRERDRTQDGEDMGFFVKNVENVQGDERDIIIFSTTFGRDPNGTFRKSFGVLGQTGGERRLNVAITRARDKVVIVTSMPVNSISDWLERGAHALQKPRDYLQAYLAYANKMSTGDIDRGQDMTARLGNGRSPSRHEGASLVVDGLAQSVERSIREMGFSPVSAHHGDAFGLDFAIEDPRTGLFGIGIECDAPRHELLRRARAREIWRPNVLGRAIRSVHRITSSSWYEKPQEELDRLRAALANALTEPEESRNERA
jgi:primosomal replication protein N''